MVASQRKYICSFCAKAFSRSEHKARHERSHTGSKPFACTICSHSFVRRDLLQRHIRTVHKTTLTTMLKNSPNAESVINSLIKVTSNENSSPATMAITAVNSSNGESDTSEKPITVTRITSPKPVTSPVHSTSNQIGKSLPMTPSDDDDVGELVNQSPTTECSQLAKPLSLVSENLKTIFVGRFRNILDEPDVMLNRAFSYLHINSLFLETLQNHWNCATSDETTFDLWCKNSPLPLALLSINLLEVMENDKRKTFLHTWQTCWQQCMKNPYDKSFLPLSLLIYVHIHSQDKLSHSLVTTSIMYQQILFAMIKSDSDPLNQVSEAWSIFDIFVNLLLKSEEFTETSTFIYQWFLNQNVYQEYNLSQFLDMIVDSNITNFILPMSTLLIAHQALFCETIMFDGFETHFKRKDSLHNAIILVNRLASKFLRQTKTNDMQNTTFNTWKIQVFILHSPPKFVDMINAYCVNPSVPQYWHLYIATWFEFIQDVIPSSDAETNNWARFHLSNRWFSGKIKDKDHILKNLKNIPLCNENINNNLAICSLPVISSLQHDWLLFDPTIKKLVLDTLLLQVKLFATSLYLNKEDSIEDFSQSMKVFGNPIVQLLLFVWYCSIYHKSDGMPKLLYRRGSESDVDNFTMENYSVSQFIKKYIVLSRKCIDTDALIENDFKKLLFHDNIKNDDDFTYFKGYHFLLGRILDKIKKHLQQIVSPSDPESEVIIKLVGELNMTISNIQEKINTHQQHISARPVSPMSSTPSSVTHTPATEMRRSNSITIGIMQTEDFQNSINDSNVRLPPLKVCQESNLGSNFEATTTGLTGNAGSSHIILPPPMVQQQNFYSRERECCSLPPPSTFFNIN